MNILFLGYVVNPSEVDNYKGVSVAGNKMQWNIISHLSKLDTCITCVSVSPRASYPKEQILINHFSENNYSSNLNCIYPWYINVPFIKQITQIIGVFKSSIKYLRNNSNSLILLYNLSVHIGIPFRLLKFFYPKNQYVCIVADLPLTDDFSRKGLYRLFSYLGKINWKKNLKKCNKYIVLNENAAKEYIGNKPYIVLDGGVDENDIKLYENNELIDPFGDNKKHIVFAGSLVKYNGILELIDAMNYISDKMLVLDIYGNGVLEDTVKQKTKNKDNIIYHGRVPNLQVLSAQRKAWLIIATRNIDDPISKVTFPSKTFEILLSETPFLSSKLDCYMNEYCEYINFIEENSPQGIARAINCISHLDYSKLKLKAINAKKFVLKTKLWNSQAIRIESFLRNNE